MSQNVADFFPTAPVSHLRERAKMLRRVRQFFDTRDFFEVQTPTLSHDTLLDRHIEPIPVTLGGERFFLQTSPEFGMKRLLAAGCEKIYQLGPVFRAGDRGPWHNVEFTMLEWYRVGDGYAEGIALLAELAAELLERGTPEIRPFGEVFAEKTGLDPHTAPLSALQKTADTLGIVAPESYHASDSPKGASGRDDWIDLIFAESVQSELGRKSPVILFDYPGTWPQLAKTAPVHRFSGPNPPKIAQRFELFADGIELANGYDELTDSAILRQRIAEIATFRTSCGRTPLPTESRFLSAMDYGIPASSGCALGFDRLMMVRLGAARIDEVLPFPIERA